MRHIGKRKNQIRSAPDLKRPANLQIFAFEIDARACFGVKRLGGEHGRAARQRPDALRGGAHVIGLNGKRYRSTRYGLQL